MSHIIPYNPILVKRAKELRQNATPAEILLWKYLKGNQMYGFDFDRQKPIDDYIVDLYCKKLKLAIEIDGGSHAGKYEYDKKRQKRLELFGIQFLRFSEKEVLKDLDNVLSSIEGWILDHAEPPQPPESIRDKLSQEGSFLMENIINVSNKP